MENSAQKQLIDCIRGKYHPAYGDRLMGEWWRHRFEVLLRCFENQAGFAGADARELIELHRIVQAGTPGPIGDGHLEAGLLFDRLGAKLEQPLESYYVLVGLRKLEEQRLADALVGGCDPLTTSELIRAGLNPGLEPTLAEVIDRA